MRTVVLLVCALTLVNDRTASADIVISGQRNIQVECELAFGPYVDLAARKHVVVAGETLGEIAARMLGGAERWPEISAINHGLDPESLKVGQVLWVPPTEAKQDGHWWHFFALAGGTHFGEQMTRIAHGEKVPHHHYFTQVYAVRSDRLPDFERALVKHREAEAPLAELLETWKAKPGFAAGAQDLPGRSSVSEESTARTRVEQWEITEIEGNAIGLRSTGEQNLDERGEVAKRGSGLFGRNGVLLGLSLFALCGIVAVARRRRAVTANA